MVGAARKLERVLVVSKADPSKINEVLVGGGFRVVEVDPDFVVCFGGDGTVLFGERCFPGVPKLVVKTSRVCRKCDYTVDKLSDLLPKIKAGDYRLHAKMKLEAEAKGVKLVGLNEI
jgi:NAD kinase